MIEAISVVTVVILDLDFLPQLGSFWKPHQGDLAPEGALAVTPISSGFKCAESGDAVGKPWRGFPNQYANICFALKPHALVDTVAVRADSDVPWQR